MYLSPIPPPEVHFSEFLIPPLSTGNLTLGHSYWTSSQESKFYVIAMATTTASSSRNLSIEFNYKIPISQNCSPGPNLNGFDRLSLLDNGGRALKTKVEQDLEKPPERDHAVEPQSDLPVKPPCFCSMSGSMEENKAQFRFVGSQSDACIVHSVSGCASQGVIPCSPTRYQSAPNSFLGETQILDYKEGSVATEGTDGSSVNRSCGSEENNGGDMIESVKNSLCSISSDISDESSSSSLCSGVTKPHKGNDYRWDAIQAVRARDGVLGLTHFRLLKPLGSGDIGRVYLCELSGTRTFFAMKVMEKEALAKRKKLVRAQTERDILVSLDHPFLPTLYTHFETDKFSCLVMEFCPGGDLHALRQRQPGKHFSEQAARFYVAEILLALEYLHMLGIIYRDLKPENVLVREDGHIMLSDFDLSLKCAFSPTLLRLSNAETPPTKKSSGHFARPTCLEPSCIMQPSCMQPTCFGPGFFSSKTKKEKKIKRKVEVHSQVSPLPVLIAEPTDARSMSFVGTHEYLAPEIIKGEGHGSAVDWWTFGVFLYELLFGLTPFKGSGNRATLFNVVGQPLKFPDSPNVSLAARDLIRGLLVKDPQQRLAYRRGAAEIKQHPFFQNVNWALIRCSNPPEVPKPHNLLAHRATVPSTSEKKVAGVDMKASDNFLDIDFF